MINSRGRPTFRRGSIVLGASVILAWSFPAAAQQLDWAVSAGATHSDNISRATTGGKGETTLDAGLYLKYNREQGRLNANIGSNLMYRNYLDHTYSDDLLGTFSGLMSYGFVPDRLNWVVEDNFGQSYINRTAVNNPGNQQNTNYFSTGPDITLPIGQRTSLSLQGRWSDVSYQSSPADNRRVLGSVGLMRQLSPQSSGSINASAERVEFQDHTFGSDFDRQSAYLGYQATGARTELNLQGGYTRLNAYGTNFDGPLAQLSVSRRTTARSMLTLSLGTVFTDAANMFRLDQGMQPVTGPSTVPPGGVNSGVTVSTRPFQSNYGTLSWAVTGLRNDLEIGGSYRNEDYVADKTQNRKSYGATASLSHAFTPVVKGRLSGAWRSDDFSSMNLRYHEWSYGASLDWSVARNVSLSAGVLRYEGSGDTTAGPGTRKYVDNTYSIRISYHPVR